MPSPPQTAGASRPAPKSPAPSPASAQRRVGRRTRRWPEGSCGPFQKQSPREAGLECSTQCCKAPRSGGLVVDLGEIVLGRLRTVGNELAEIFGGRLGPGDEHFTARTGEIRLDLNRLVNGLGGRQLVDACEKRLGILVDRLLDVAADLGDLADGISSRGLEHVGDLLGAGIGLRSTLLGRVGGLLHPLAGSRGNFRILQVLERFGHGGERVLDVGKQGIGLGGHWSLHPQGLSYGLTPSEMARGAICMTCLMVRCNKNIAPRYHEIVNMGSSTAEST